MMYHFFTSDDGTEFVYSEILSDGKIKVYAEKPDEKDGFHYATCYLPHYDWQDVNGFTAQETEQFQKIIKSNIHLIISNLSNILKNESSDKLSIYESIIKSLKEAIEYENGNGTARVSVIHTVDVRDLTENSNTKSSES